MTKEQKKCKEYINSSNCHFLEMGINKNLDTTEDAVFLFGQPNFSEKILQELKKENLVFLTA